MVTMMLESGWKLTVEVEGVPDASKDDSVGDLGEEVVLEVGVVDYVCQGIARCSVAGGVEGDELGNWNLFFQS